MTFEQWWQANYEDGFTTVSGAMKLAFKEVAEKAWNAAYDKGFEYGCSKPGLFCSCQADVGC